MKVAEGWIAPTDYKVYCFHGIPKYFMLCIGREKGTPLYYYFDTNWKHIRISEDDLNVPEDFAVKKPTCLDKMIKCAQKLSKPFPFVRVDFFICGEKLYFGELTFTPSAGYDKDIMKETDISMGKLIDLSNAGCYGKLYEN